MKGHLTGLLTENVTGFLTENLSERRDDGLTGRLQRGGVGRILTGRILTGQLLTAVRTAPLTVMSVGCQRFTRASGMSDRLALHERQWGRNDVYG